MAASYTSTITSIRYLIGDSSIPQDLSDTIIEDVIDRHSVQVFQLEIMPAHSSKKVYRASSGNWIEATIYDSDDTEVSPSTSNLIRGYWKFTEEQSRLYVDGLTCNIYASAAECITILIAVLRKEYSFSTGDGNFQRNERIETLKEMHNHYSAKAVEYSIKGDDF